ncbi:MAG: DUF1152 domain-containing protein [Halobacteriales archaeon]|nr:DUF1152 domain-containing protein [Halobacteriales archaeon]
MNSLEDSFNHDRALVFGIGGGGDIVGTIPTARLLEQHGIETTLGGLAWERDVIDPQPGPRSFDTITDIERISASVARVNDETQTTDEIVFAETHVARHTDRPVVLIDVTHGATEMATGLETACEQLDIDLLVGVDAGGDALAVGDEPGLRSPLADALSLVALDSVALPSVLGVFGMGSDGELTAVELQAGVARAADRDGLLGAWGLTPRACEEMDPLLDVVPTEASRLPVEAAYGAFDVQRIRDGSRTVHLNPASVCTFYFDPSAVAASSAIVPHVRGTTSIEAADTALAEAGYISELRIEEGNTD